MIKYIQLYRHYNVGEGEMLALSKDSVRSGAVLKIPFSSTSKDLKERKKAKLREDRQLCVYILRIISLIFTVTIISLIFTIYTYDG